MLRKRALLFLLLRLPNSLFRLTPVLLRTRRNRLDMTMPMRKYATRGSGFEL